MMNLLTAPPAIMNESGFHKVLPRNNHNFFEPKPKQTRKQKKHEKNPAKTKPQKKAKSKKPPNFLIYKNGGFCQRAIVLMTQGLMFPHLRIRCMILLTENKCFARLLCSAFAKDIIEASVEKMLSLTKAEVHISIID